MSKRITRVTLVVECEQRGPVERSDDDVAHAVMALVKGKSMVWVPLATAKQTAYGIVGVHIERREGAADVTQEAAA